MGRTGLEPVTLCLKAPVSRLVSGWVGAGSARCWATPSITCRSNAGNSRWMDPSVGDGHTVAGSMPHPDHYAHKRCAPMPRCCQEQATGSINRCLGKLPGPSIVCELQTRWLPYYQAGTTCQAHWPTASAHSEFRLCIPKDCPCRDTQCGPYQDHP